MDSDQSAADDTAFLAHLKFQAMIAYSELIKEKAHKELIGRGFIPEEPFELTKLVNRWRTRCDKFELTARLWEKCAARMIDKHKYEEAADCLQHLSDLQYKYGTDKDIEPSLTSLMTASKFYKESSQTEKAVITKRQAMARMELNPQQNYAKLIQGYHECSTLYKSMDNLFLEDLSLDIKQFFAKRNDTLLNMPSTSTYNSSAINITVLSDSNSDYARLEQMDDKRLVRKQIREMQKTNGHSISSSDTESECEKNEDNAKLSDNCLSKPSKKLLQENLKNLRKKRLSEMPETSDKDDTLSESEPNLPQPTTLITRASPDRTIKVEDPKSQIPIKRSRKPKPRELSEQHPKNRILKMNQNSIEHYFMKDIRDPENKLLCIICNESIRCYRLSTINDHLRSKKHQNKAMKKRFEKEEEERQMIELYKLVCCSGDQQSYSCSDQQTNYSYQTYGETSCANNSGQLALEYPTTSMAAQNPEQTYHSMSAPTDPSLFANNSPQNNESVPTLSLSLGKQMNGINDESNSLNTPDINFEMEKIYFS